MMVSQKVPKVVIASAAKQSRILRVLDFTGLLCRYAPRNDMGMGF